MVIELRGSPCMHGYLDSQDRLAHINGINAPTQQPSSYCVAPRNNEERHRNGITAYLPAKTQ